MIQIDTLCYKSGLRNKNGTVKFAYAVITLLICVTSRSSAAAVTSLLLNSYLIVKKGGVKLRVYKNFLLMPFVFLLLTTIALIFNIRSEPLDLFALPVGSVFITGSTEGLLYASQLILTALSCVSCMYFLSMTTPMPDILNVLNRLHCPQLIGELMLLIYRYIFVLLETAGNIRISQKCRLGDRNYGTYMRSFAALGSTLMLRAIMRARVLYEAMEARCYDGTIKVLSEERKAEKKDIVLIVLFEIFLAFIAWGRFF